MASNLCATRTPQNGWLPTKSDPTFVGPVQVSKIPTMLSTPEFMENDHFFSGKVGRTSLSEILLILVTWVLFKSQKPWFD